MGKITDDRRGAIKPHAGFTLLETMIALSILTIGLLAMFRMFAYSGTGVHQGGKMTEAVFLAQQKMETFKATPYANIVTNLAGETSGIYTTKWEITEDAALKLKTVKVTVSWNPYPGSTRGHEISLYSKRASEK